MSRTPRVDAFIAAKDIFCDSDELFDFLNFAADLEQMLDAALAENEALKMMVKGQRCCRNCGNHASWNFDTCGFGESSTDPEEGPHCRRNNLSRWRPMEYRREKEAAERGE